MAFRFATHALVSLAAAPSRRRASSTSASRRWRAATIRRPTSRGSSRSASRRAAERRADHLHAGAVPLAVLLPGRGSPLLRARRDRFPGRPPRPSRRSRERHDVGHHRLALREARGRAVPQHRRRHRRRRVAARHLSQDAHPRRPALSTRSSTSRPGDTGFRAWKTQYGHDRRADLLGSVVSRGRAAHRAAGRRDPLLPDRHRLAPVGEGRVRPGAARRRGS